MRTAQPRRHPIAAGLALALLMALPVSAQVGQPIGEQLEHPTERTRQQQGEGLAWEAVLGAEYSDNRGRAASGGEDDLLLTPSVGFDFFRRSSRFQSGVEGRIEFRDSLGNVYDDELRARLSSYFNYAIWPERLYWTVQDYAGIEPVDVYEAGAPDNLQQTNVFITGPSLRISPRGLWTGEIDARWTRSYAEETESFNGERVTASAVLVHRLHPARTLSLGIEGTDVRYDEPLRFIGGPPDAPVPDQPLGNPDHERRDAWLRYRSAFPRMQLDATGGRTRIEFADGGTLEGLLARLSLNWLPNEIHEASLHVVREYSDAVRDLVSQIGALDPDFNLQPRPEIGPAIFLLRAVELRYGYTFHRGKVEVIPYSRDYDYQRDADFLDQQSTGVRGELTYLVDPRTTFRAGLGVERRDFTQVDREDDNLYAGAYLERRFSRQWGIRGGITRYQRDSSAAGSDYEENVVSVALVYFGGR